MKLNEIHQIWLRSTPLPDEAENTRKFAEEHNIHYVLWDWEKLNKKFPEFDFFQEKLEKYPAKYLWIYMEQFFTILLTAEYPCFVVNAFVKVDRDITKFNDVADIYLGGSSKAPSINIIGVSKIELANTLKNTIIGQYNTHKDIILLEKESLLTPMTGGSFISRRLFPVIHLNKARIAYFNDVPLLQEKDVAVEKFFIDQQTKIGSDPAEVLPSTDELAAAYAASEDFAVKEVMEPFWLPKGARRIIIISNDAENIDNFEWRVGDCAIHMNEAAFAESMAITTVCTHILFVDMYPRSKMRVPKEFKQYRNIVFYDKRVKKEWKTSFLNQSGRMPSLLCCLVTEFHAAYPDKHIYVLGADLSKRSVASVAEHKRFERAWMLQNGAYLSGSHYKCMMLLYKLRKDDRGMKAQYDTWVKNIPDDFVWKFMCDAQPDFAKDSAIIANKDVAGNIDFANTITQALSWNWDYLFIGTDSMVVNIDRLKDCLHDKIGHVRIFNGKPFYMLQAGFVLARHDITSIDVQARSLSNVSAKADVSRHSLEFIPFYQYKKEGAEWVTLGSMTPEEILSLEE